MTNPLIIYGKNGQLGSALTALANDAIVIASTEVDFSVYENVMAKLAGISPRAIINATAYTNVDLAESELQAAHKANVEIPATLAKYAKEIDVPFVHYSTDYVFGGDGDTPHKEDDATAPLNVYGKTKRDGELAVEAIGGKYLIFRTSWVYDATHKNFLTTMLRLGREREELSVVRDQIGAPTFAADLSLATLEILNQPDAGRGIHPFLTFMPPSSKNKYEHEEGVNTPSCNQRKFPSGIYHLCNSGETNWYEYAKTIFELARNKNIPLKVNKIIPITSAQYTTPAKRPLNSRLDCTKAKSVLGIEMSDWRDSLERCFQETSLRRIDRREHEEATPSN